MMPIIHGPTDTDQRGRRDWDQQDPGFECVPSSIPDPHLYEQEKMRQFHPRISGRSVDQKTTPSTHGPLTPSRKQSEVPHPSPTKRTMSGKETPVALVQQVGACTDGPARQSELRVLGV